MSKYVLIESRDPYEVADVPHDYELAASLARGGNEVTLFLVQNGVLPARSGAREAGLESVVESGVKVLADDYSLRERAIGRGELRNGVAPAELDVVVDSLGAGHKTLWL